MTDLTQIPDSVVQAERTVSRWFAERNISDWQLGDSRSRAYVRELTLAQIEAVYREQWYIVPGEAQRPPPTPLPDMVVRFAHAIARLCQRLGAQAASEPVISVKDRPGTIAVNLLRVYFERAINDTEVFAARFPLARDGEGPDYACANTQVMWLGFAVGMRCAERLSNAAATPAGERPAQADAPEALRQKLNHIEECADVWGVTGMSRFKAIKRTVEEMRVLLLVPEAAGERPGAQGEYDGVTTHPEFGSGAKAPSTAHLTIPCVVNGHSRSVGVLPGQRVRDLIPSALAAARVYGRDGEWIVTTEQGAVIDHDAEAASLLGAAPIFINRPAGVVASGPLAAPSTGGAETAALYGFDRENLEAVAEGLSTGYEASINVGNVTGMGDDHLESTTAYAARFIRTVLASSAPASSTGGAETAEPTRVPTAAEDRWLHEASRRAATPVAGGRLVSASPASKEDGVTAQSQPVAWRTRITWVDPAKGAPGEWVYTDREDSARAALEHNSSPTRDVDLKYEVEALVAVPHGVAPTSKITSVAEFCAEAERIGLTATDLADALSKRPEFADCLPTARVREEGNG